MINTNINLSDGYRENTFISFLRGFLPDDFKIENIKLSHIGFKSKYINQIKLIGQVKITEKLGESELFIYEIKHISVNDPRVTLTRESFKILQNFGKEKALCIYISDNNPEQYRFSLITFDVDIEEGKIKKLFSNPRRFSYLLGKGTKIHTPYEFLIKKGKIKDFEDLRSRFSIEVVNKEFYNQIARLFTKLVGGERSGYNGGEGELKLPSTNDHKIKQEFGVRLIGRLIFCWFLKKKGLISDNILSLEGIKKGKKEYYHCILEPLFFQILNEKIKDRNPEVRNEYFDNIPFLNGGLFDPDVYDYFEESKHTHLNKHINTLKIPDEWFEDLFSVLDSYNFTVDENSSFDIEISIDPEMLGMIFENLLAEINPETSETARKLTGSFYTPRPIVEFMANQSLKYYLLYRTGLEEQKIAELLSYTSEDDDINFSESEVNKIMDAIDKVKILDPACGSGAFPMAMLHKIVFVLKRIDPDSRKWIEMKYKDLDEVLKNDEIENASKGMDYKFKLSIIQNSIYGVDIQEIAVEIAKLRFFLSLIVDEVIENKKNNRGIKPLPNLEFKFVCADTLGKLKIKEKKSGSLDIFENNDDINELKILRKKYLNSFGKDKYNIEKKFKKIQDRMFKRYIGWEDKSGQSQTSLLSQWDPFSGKKTNWFDLFWMFGVEDGFDIIIGNPPYIQLQKALPNYNNLKYADLYKPIVLKDGKKSREVKRYKTFKRTGDIYVLFYERGMELLKPRGILSYITSNKWMRAGYGGNLRKFLSEKNPLKLIDLGPGVFSTATVDTNILLIENTNVHSQDIVSLKAITLKDKTKISNLNNNDFVVLDNLSEDSWIILTPEEQKIKQKIERIGTPLKDWDISIYYGIKTGYNDAFIINGDKKDDLISKDRKSAEIIKPILRGRDIKRYKAKFADKWLINTHNGYKNSENKYIPPIEINDYPAIKEHLDKFWDELQIRQDRGITPYNLRNCAYLKEFEKEKIIWIELCDKAKFTIEYKYHTLAGTFAMTGNNLKYLLALLNSNLSLFYFDKIATSSGIGTNMWKKYKIEFLPIPKIHKYQAHPFSELVDKILIKKERGENTSVEEHQIDEMVYNLYGLTEEEIRIVEGEK